LQNDWDDYENLFKRLQNQSELVGLDFACGPGRNIVKYNGRFKRLDGVDISPINIEKAQTYTSNNGIKSVLYTSSGVDISVVPSETYDFVMSTIALQHICVYDIRYSIMKDIHRVLKDGGVFTAQMGFGSPSPSTVGYYENYYDAESSNRACDVCIETTEQLEKDLLKIGYKDFKYTIGPVGPGDCHPNWIYFSCMKTNMELASYSKLIELSKQFNLGFHLESSIDDSLKLSNHYHPWSMREHEAKIVYDLIVQNGLKSGFEIATAFGISASVMGQALKITGGKLVTMDAYIEENFNYSGGYDINTKLVKNVDADGYKMAKALIEVLGITDNVALEIGWSPDDTGSIIDRTFGTTKLDFAFIDGGHTQAQIDADVKAVLPYLADDCILLFHDHVDVSEETKEFIRYNGFINEKNYHTGFNLYAYSKGNKTLI
jgi:predicted O-methyltransferase YrrM/ubiquinone/menaquinone biosynthesis C-methylase UbiE